MTENSVCLSDIARAPTGLSRRFNEKHLAEIFSAPRVPEAFISPLVWFVRRALVWQSCSDLMLHIVSCKSCKVRQYRGPGYVAPPVNTPKAFCIVDVKAVAV